MKIIKKNDWVGTQVTCCECKSLFQLEKGDEKKVKKEDLSNDYGRNINFFVRCPVCGAKCNLGQAR